MVTTTTLRACATVHTVPATAIPTKVGASTADSVYAQVLGLPPLRGFAQSWRILESRERTWSISQLRPLGLWAPRRSVSRVTGCALTERDGLSGGGARPMC